MKVLGIQVSNLLLPALLVGWILLVAVVFPRLGIRT